MFSVNVALSTQEVGKLIERDPVSPCLSVPLLCCIVLRPRSKALETEHSAGQGKGITEPLLWRRRRAQAGEQCVRSSARATLLRQPQPGRPAQHRAGAARSCRHTRITYACKRGLASIAHVCDLQMWRAHEAHAARTGPCTQRYAWMIHQVLQRVSRRSAWAAVRRRSARTVMRCGRRCGAARSRSACGTPRAASMPRSDLARSPAARCGLAIGQLGSILGRGVPMQHSCCAGPWRGAQRREPALCGLRVSCFQGLLT